MSRRFNHGLALASVLCLTLTACGSDDIADLRSYAAQINARPAGKIDPLPDIAPSETYAYASSGLRDPFTPSIDDSATAVKTSNSLIKPDVNRPKEALEEYPLDVLKMMGTLARGEETWSLIKAPDGAVYRVRPNDHVGQNYGKITRISDESIELVEIIEDGQGGWIERAASLVLIDEVEGGEKKR